MRKIDEKMYLQDFKVKMQKKGKIAQEMGENENLMKCIKTKL